MARDNESLVVLALLGADEGSEICQSDLALFLSKAADGN